MQLHLLVGRTGANTNIILAWSLELSETAETYSWFANQCHEAGFGDLVQIAEGRMKRNPVLFSDGFKGTHHFAVKFPRLHHARCALHLAKSIRHTLKRMKKAGASAVNVGFADAQVISVCTAKTDAAFNMALRRLRSTSEHAAGRLLSTPLLEFSVNAMAKSGIACFGHCTSNAVEGTNGVLEKQRHRHPYEFVDYLVRYICERMAFHMQMFEKMNDNRRLLTKFASDMFTESGAIARRRGYKMQAQTSGNYLVWDPSSRHQVCSVFCEVHSQRVT